jgi:mannose PTS system EIIA component
MLRVFRVDDRLIHGQVVVGWVKRLNLDAILVANDNAATDLFQRHLMELAVPRDVSCFFYHLNDVPKMLVSREIGLLQSILLVNSLKDALELIQSGVKCLELNIGGLHYKENKEKYTDSIFLDDSDIALIDKILGLNVHIWAQPLPDDNKTDILRLLRRDEE